MDIKMNYIEAGTGFPLIMIHGNEDVCEYFEHQLEFFAASHHCYAIDSRAHGKTPRGKAPMTIRQMAQDFIDFMDEHAIEQADFIGFSDGGNIMLIMAMEHPERIRRMVVDGANLDLDGVEPEVVSEIMSEYNELLARAEYDKKSRARAEIIGLMVNDPNIRPEELEAISVPTLVVAGTEDLILEEHTRLIASSIPGAELAFVQGDHFCAGQNPDEFNKVVAEFLNR